MFLTHQFSAITRKKLGFLNSQIKKEIRENGWFYLIEINSDDVINYDLKLLIKGKKITFYSWFNLWYATFEIISKYVIKNNYFGDSAYTFSIGEIDAEKRKLVDVTKRCLELGIEKAVVGMRIGDIGFAIQQYAEANGFGVVRELVGHGVGVQLHEKPEIPNYGKRGAGPKLEEGMVIAIEPMINAGVAGVKFHSDGWTVTSKDNRPSAHFEHTVAVKKGKADVLSTFSAVEKVLQQKK
jgi:methionine aminopeptidase